MKLNFAYHEGSQATKPLETDTTSSPTVVYIRKNIERVTREDPQSGDEVSLWGYDEAEMSFDDYPIYLAEQTAAKVDYVAMMADIDLDFEGV